jgi:transcriptional regulator with XRE-family HTH domain
MSASSKHPDPIGFGPRLAALRKAAGYTQVELAEALGISQRMVAYYESTDDHPLAKVLRHLSATLGITTDELLGLVEPSLPIEPQKKTRRARKP